MASLKNVMLQLAHQQLAAGLIKEIPSYLYDQGIPPHIYGKTYAKNHKQTNKKK